MTFTELGLQPDILSSLEKLEFKQPSPIQAQAIPYILASENDLIALAQTGTGKTAAFSLPVLQKINAKSRDTQALILCPTRELAVQIAQDIRTFSKDMSGISTTAVYGGENIMGQIKDVKRGSQIIVGTPGRVHDLIRRKVLKLQTVQWVVLDEADEMLDMGFKDDLDVILGETPDTKQTLLFSATLSKHVHRIAKEYMHNPDEISIGEKNTGSKNVTHEYYIVKSTDRFEALKRILDNEPDMYGIIFCRTKLETQEIADKLNRANYEAEAIHGDVSQNIRTKIMAKFKQKKITLLVATDVAARGIDVNNLTHVLNYNLPDQNESYTHRSGRTGRAGNQGTSITIIGPRETRRIAELERIINQPFTHQRVPSQENIIAKQVAAYLENSDTHNTQNDVLLHAPEVTDQFKKFTKDELITLLLNAQFSGLSSHYRHDRDINATAQQGRERGRGKEMSGPMMQINVGKKDRFSIKDFFNAIKSQRSLKKIEIGTIDIHSDYTNFQVAERDINKVMKFLPAAEFKGQTLTVTQTTAESSAPRRNRKRRPRRNRR